MSFCTAGIKIIKAIFIYVSHGDLRTPGAFFMWNQILHIKVIEIIFFMLPPAFYLTGYVFQRFFLCREKRRIIELAGSIFLINDQLLIGRHILKNLEFLVRPDNQQAVHIMGAAQAKMQSGIGGGLKTSGEHELLELHFGAI